MKKLKSITALFLSVVLASSSCILAVGETISNQVEGIEGQTENISWNEQLETLVGQAIANMSTNVNVSDLKIKEEDIESAKQELEVMLAVNPQYAYVSGFTYEMSKSASDENQNETTVASTEATTVASTEATTVASTEATTVASTEVTTVASTEATTVASTEATTAASTEATTAASTEATTAASTEATTVASTEETTTHIDTENQTNYLNTVQIQYQSAFVVKDTQNQPDVMAIQTYLAKYDVLMNSYKATVNTAMTDVEKVYAVYNYLEANNTDIDFAAACYVILNELNIKSIIVTRENDSWNMVQIGENWYHVRKGSSSNIYEQFLVNDATMVSAGLSGWKAVGVETPQTGSTDTFAEYIFRTHNLAMQYYKGTSAKGYWFYTKENTICKQTIDGKSTATSELVDGTINGFCMHGNLIYVATQNQIVSTTASQFDIITGVNLEMKDQYEGYTITGISFDSDYNLTVSLNNVGNIEKPNSEVTIDTEVDNKVEGLELFTKPTKISYEENEALNLEGMNLIAVYKDGSKVLVDEKDCTVTGFDSTKGGNQTVKISYKGSDATYDVYIEMPLKNITLNTESVSLVQGRSQKLTVNYAPETTTDNKTVTWLSADQNIATVDAEGNVAAVNVGSTTITAQVGPKVASCTIVVTPKILVDSISLNYKNVTMITNSTREMKVTFNPVDTTEDKTVIWTSSDDSIASVDNNGVVTSHAAGGVVIKAENGAKKAICIVTVRATYEAYYEGIDYSTVFDPYYYADTNPDVKAAFGYDGDMLLWHFVNFGMSEGRWAKENFNVVYYMYGLLNDDLRATYGGDMKQYYYHYMNFGQYEGRSVSDYDDIFDPDYYLAANPDVYQNIVDRFTKDGNTRGWALWHYYEYGMNEARRGSSQFGVLNYLAQNGDVYSAYGTNYRAVCAQYLLYGRAEHRDTMSKIDIYNMQTLRPDVVEAVGNDITKWIEWYISYGSLGF